MAYYFLTASKDASVYLQQPNQNTGLDEILEISKVYYGNIKDVSHALLKFDLGYVSASISNNSISMSSAECGPTPKVTAALRMRPLERAKFILI
jgi:hypothetical protein